MRVQRGYKIQAKVVDWQALDMIWLAADFISNCFPIQTAPDCSNIRVIIGFSKWQPPLEYRVLKFLQRSNPEQKIGVYENSGHVFGAKISPTCVTYPLFQTGVDNKNSHPVAAKDIKRNFYIDVFAQSEEAVRVCKHMRTKINWGRFNLLKRACNIQVVTGNIPDDGRSEAKTTRTSRISTPWHAM